MVQGRLKVAWGMQSQFMALFANANRSSKDHPKPFQPREFNPMIPQKRMESFSEMEADLIRMGLKKPKQTEGK